MVKAFCSAIEDAGYYACFYCNLNWYRNRLDMEVLKVYDLWLAQWGYTATSYSCGMWQYTCKGSVSGINGDVDMNIAYKDYPALTRGLRSRNQASNFKDVPADHWAAEAVGRVVEAGIMGGQPDGTFQGDAPTTRYELASALDRLMQK
jgi:hypothetical protein